MRLCDYHFGVGSDGVLEVVSADGDEAEVVIWNPDGSTAELSGNGTRIAARWLARRSGLNTVLRIRVGPREVVGRMRGTLDVEMDMGAVDVQEPETLDVGNETLEFTPASVGHTRSSAVSPSARTCSGSARSSRTTSGSPTARTCSSSAWTGRATSRSASGSAEAGDLSSGTSAVATAASRSREAGASPVTVHLAAVTCSWSSSDSMQARLTGPAQEIFIGEASEELRL